MKYNTPKITLLSFLLVFSLLSYSQESKTISVVDDAGLPLPGVDIIVNGESVGKTGRDGTKTIDLSSGDRIEARSTGYISPNPIVYQSSIANLRFKLTASDEAVEKRSYNPSPASQYSGISATLAYNIFEESSINNLISTANIKLGVFDLGAFNQSDTSRFSLYLVGTLADFKADNKEEAEKQLANIAQSNQGLQIGLAPVYTLKTWTNKKDTTNAAYLRLTSSISGKYNNFTLEDSTAVGLPQARITLGIEFEGIKLVSTDKPIHFGIYYYRNWFSQTAYEKIFNEQVEAISGLEAGLIVPLSNILGLRLSLTTSPDFDNIWSGGIVLWPGKTSDK